MHARVDSFLNNNLSLNAIFYATLLTNATVCRHIPTAHPLAPLVSYDAYRPGAVEGGTRPQDAPSRPARPKPAHRTGARPAAGTPRCGNIPYLSPAPSREPQTGFFQNKRVEMGKLAEIGCTAGKIAAGAHAIKGHLGRALR